MRFEQIKMTGPPRNGPAIMLECDQEKGGDLDGQKELDARKNH